MIDIKPARKNGGSKMVLGQESAPAVQALPSVARPAGDPEERLKAVAGVPTGIRLARIVLEAWHVAAGRPENAQKLDKDVNAIDRKLKLGWVNAENYEEIVSAASYLPPEKGDERDIRRLLRSIGDQEGMDKARTAKNNRPEPYEYSYKSRLANTEDVLSLLGFEDYELRGDELSAVKTLQAFQPSVVERMRDRTRAFLGYDEVLPSDVVRVGRKRIDMMSATGATGVQQGRAATAALSENLVECDVLAENMLYDGSSTTDEIIAFHQLIPVGYWKAVERLVIERDVEPREAYGLLEEEWPGIDPLKETRS